MVIEFETTYLACNHANLLGHVISQSMFFTSNIISKRMDGQNNVLVCRLAAEDLVLEKLTIVEYNGVYNTWLARFVVYK